MLKKREKTKGICHCQIDYSQTWMIQVSSYTRKSLNSQLYEYTGVTTFQYCGCFPEFSMIKVTLKNYLPHISLKQTLTIENKWKHTQSWHITVHNIVFCNKYCNMKSGSSLSSTYLRVFAYLLCLWVLWLGSLKFFCVEDISLGVRHSLVLVITH